jgi:hypothetical protein
LLNTQTQNSDYYPVRINVLENAVENIGILEKSGVSDYTLFGSIISERSWSLPDDCNTYTSLYYDNVGSGLFENENGLDFCSRTDLNAIHLAADTCI